MKYRGLARAINKFIAPEVIEVTVRISNDIKKGECVIAGGFNPYFEEASLSVPIELVLVVRHPENEIVDEEAVLKEVRKTINHELVHLEQYEEGRFIFDWEGTYEENPNEIEAYAREGNGTFFSDAVYAL